MAVRALRRALGRWAARGPAPVFAAVGAGGRDGVEALSLDPRVRLVDTPRHASVLLVAGTVPPRAEEGLDRVHDQIPHPRATVRWEGRGGGAEGGGDVGVDDPVPAIREAFRSLVAGERGGEDPRLPDEPPNPWRGRGDHGQGGTGMMGGTPWGRPMAMTDEDVRDGLALDRLELTVGPFYPPFPPGLVLEVALQGDVVQEATVVHGAFPQPLPPVVRAVGEGAVPSRRARRARAALLLRRAYRVLRAAGARTQAEAALAASLAEDVPAATVSRLRRWVRGGGTLAALPAAPGGEPWLDVRGRLDRWLEEAARLLAAARSAGPSRGSATGDPLGPVEAPVAPGAPFDEDVEPGEAAERLAEAAPGLEWGELVLVVAALDPVAPLEAP